jgi:hypothetical protein
MVGSLAGRGDTVKSSVVGLSVRLLPAGGWQLAAGSCLRRKADRTRDP